MSNELITLPELLVKLNEQNIHFDNVMVNLDHVDIVHTTTAAALLYPKEDIDIVKTQEVTNTLESDLLSSNNTTSDNILRVTFTQFKKMFSAGDKAVIHNQVPGCTFVPVNNGVGNRHVLIDLSNPSLEPFSDLIRNAVEKRKMSKVFYTLKDAMDKIEMNENMARRRLAKQPCVMLINTKRSGRSLWPLRSILAIANTD